MAARVLHYHGMGLDAARRRGELDADGELRALPVVIHSGERTWRASGAVRRVVVDNAGELVLPSGRYLLVDRSGTARDDAGNVVAAALALEAAPSPAVAEARLQALEEGLRGADAASARAAMDGVLAWLGIRWRRLFPGKGEAELDAWRRKFLNEENDMTTLADRVKVWEAELLERGEERGIKRGIERGAERERERERERQRTMLARLAGRKFGPATARELAARIAGVSDPEELALVGERIIDCDASADLLERVARSG